MNTLKGKFNPQKLNIYQAFVVFTSQRSVDLDKCGEKKSHLNLELLEGEYISAVFHF